MEVLAQHQKLTDQMTNDAGYADYIDAFMGSVWDKAHKKNGWTEVQRAFGRQFHPANNPEQFRALLRKDLFSARTYQVTEKMVDAVSGTVANSAKSVLKIEEDGLPSPCGFVWLDKEIRSPDRNGNEVAYRAISWGPQSLSYGKVGQEEPSYVAPGVRVTFWTYTHDRDYYWVEREANLHDAKFAYMELLYAHTNVIPFGTRVGIRLEDPPEYREDVIVWLRTLWAFMDTEIVSTAQQHVSRPFFRRAQKKSLGRPDVNVVSLRHVVVPHDPDREPGHREIDWKCMWVVSGHHRHLESYTGTKHHAVPDPSSGNKFCSTCGSRITWVHAYVKGPEGMPLRSVEQLYRLER